ncbi:MAG TPA: isoprenylcysteine carboxylmethyltransferase family protein [Gemmatimonadaceae bacterium]
MTLIRHLLAIAALPFVVAVLIPIWIARASGVHPALGTTTPRLLTQVAGLALLTVGLLLFVSSLRRFARDGKGTLAPWDPPRNLVVRGPYRYVRNPMISGVLFVLFGEALMLLSGPHVQWALIFLVINLIYIPLLEEQQLKARFGEEYIEYCRNVPRLVPRLRPWSPPTSGDNR